MPLSALLVGTACGVRPAPRNRHRAEEDVICERETPFTGFQLESARK